jgi:hypothetical protein
VTELVDLFLDENVSSSGYITTNGIVTVNNGLEGMWKEAALLRHLSGGTQKNHEHLNSG